MPDTTRNTPGFTCFSTQYQGCGAKHRTQEAARRCCRLHREKYGESRAVFAVSSRDEMRDKYPASPAAQARRDEYLAQKGMTATAPTSKPTADPVLATLNEALAGASSNAEPSMASEPKPEPAAAPEAQSADTGDATPEHPLQGLADQIKPLLGELPGTTSRIEVIVPDRKPVEIEGDQHQNFELLLKLVAAGENVFMSGPAGSGKTTGAKKVAEALDMDLIVQPVAMDKFEATGFVDAGGSYRESAVYRWATAEKPSLLLIDEIDGWLPQALVALNPILDNRIGIFPGGQQFEINPEHRVIATANTWGTGADAEYVGRNRLDAASLDRFGARLEWDYDEAFERRLMVGQFGDNGERATTLSQSVRVKLRECGLKIVWGPRQTIGLARRLAAGLNAREAFSVSALAALSETNQGRVLDSLDLS